MIGKFNPTGMHCAFQIPICYMEINCFLGNNSLWWKAHACLIPSLYKGRHVTGTDKMSPKSIFLISRSLFNKATNSV